VGVRTKNIFHLYTSCDIILSDDTIGLSYYEPFDKLNEENEDDEFVSDLCNCIVKFKDQDESNDFGCFYNQNILDSLNCEIEKTHYKIKTTKVSTFLLKLGIICLQN
jgi:hypothetical protein